MARGTRRQRQTAATAAQSAAAQPYVVPRQLSGIEEVDDEYYNSSMGESEDDLHVRLDEISARLDVMDAQQGAGEDLGSLQSASDSASYASYLAKQIESNAAAATSGNSDKSKFAGKARVQNAIEEAIERSGKRNAVDYDEYDKYYHQGDEENNAHNDSETDSWGETRSKRSDVVGESTESRNSSSRAAPHSRLHHMSFADMSEDSSDYDRADDLDVAASGNNGSSGEDDVVVGPGAERSIGSKSARSSNGAGPHMRLHHMSIDSMSYASSGYDDSNSQGSGRREQRIQNTVGSQASDGWETMSDKAREIITDVMSNVSNDAEHPFFQEHKNFVREDLEGGGYNNDVYDDNYFQEDHAWNEADGQPFQEQEHFIEEDIESGSYGRDNDNDAEYYEEYNDELGEQNWESNHSNMGNPSHGDIDSIRDSMASNSNMGANRLHRISLHSIDDDLSSDATPISSGSVLQLSAKGYITHLSNYDQQWDGAGRGQKDPRSNADGDELESIATQENTHYSSKESYQSRTMYSENSEYDCKSLARESKSNCCRSCFLHWTYCRVVFAIIVVCITLMAIILVIVFTTKSAADDNSNQSVNTASAAGNGAADLPGSSNGTPRTSEELKRRDDIKSKLIDTGLSGASLFDDGTSPQHVALEWISFTDGANLAPSDEFLLTRYALAVFYLSAKKLEKSGTSMDNNDLLNGSVEWLDSSNWMSSRGYCAWAGVECSLIGSTTDVNLPVTRINVSSNNILAPFPVELTLLGDSLETIDMSNNMIQGSLPAEKICESFSRLESLDLSDNLLTGSLVSGIGDCTSLRYLHLDGNDFTSTIPTDIGELVNLVELTLGSNVLNGSMPNLDSLEKLEKLNLQENSLTGEIDWGGFHYMINLKELHLHDNAFVGILPYQIGFLGFLSTLEILRIDTNEFSGPIPRAIKNTALRELYLDNNNFSGEIPIELGDLETLKILRIHGNGFVGSVPTAVCNLNLIELESDCNSRMECSCCTQCW